ncbi:hypothetical protein L596_019168 [Steinernema carpocapsae]|uniref:C-type lectin domain-containing protein n=1 Tax=Steinernema carpocapsae TaxID=34508 RepID=A0A4U5N8C9_STECR|nr:hypothetical protein L596_019168 [Steinernema carpocapsae]
MIQLLELTQGFNERQFWINVKVGEGRKNCSDSNCTFANWGPERPCVSMESGNGRWALRNCSNRFPFLCEFDPIQIPPRDELPEYQNTQFAQCRPCPSGWAQHGLHCYGFFDEIKNWNNAEEFCENLGGHLASIHFQTEIDFVEEVFKDVLSSSWPPFVGATTQRNETKWTDGTTFTFDKWAPHLGPRNGHCVNIQQHKLASVLCNTFANFICKKSVVELRN